MYERSWAGVCAVLIAAAAESNGAVVARRANTICTHRALDRIFQSDAASCLPSDDRRGAESLEGCGATVDGL